MTFTIVAADGTCLLPGSVAPGPYDIEIEGGTVTLHPLVRAQSEPPEPRTPRRDTEVSRPKSRGGAASREYKGRSWSRVPAGTRLTGPHGVGAVTMGPRGELANGRTPNQHLVHMGITANAWQVYKLDDGRTVGTAYDMNTWP